MNKYVGTIINLRIQEWFIEPYNTSLLSQNDKGLSTNVIQLMFTYMGK